MRSTDTPWRSRQAVRETGTTSQSRRLRHLAFANPVVDPACDSASQAEFAEGPLLTRDAMLWFWRSYLGAAPASPRDRYALPEADLAGLPPTSVATAAHDVLRDEGRSPRACRRRASPSSSGASRA